MIETNNTPNLLQEYVLDLLPLAEKQQMAQRIGADPMLLSKVKQERQVGQQVKQTLQQAGHIKNGRLAQLMPAIPKQKRPFGPSFVPRQLAMVAMLLVLLLGGWQWFSNDHAAIWTSTPTTVAVTATMTHTPTATETQIGPMETAVANQNKLNAAITPAPPPPTPIAAVPINTN
jgi:anti-sigma factor RsiW